MSSQVSYIYLRTFLIARRVPQQHIVKVRDYCRWVSRKPSKVILPNLSTNKEKIIDLTEHYESKQTMEEEYIPEPGEGAFRLRKVKPPREKPSEHSKPDLDNEKGLFNYNRIDALTQNVDTKKKGRQPADKFNFESRKKDKDISQDSDSLVSVDVFDPKGNYIYEKLPFKDAVVGNRIIKLKNRKNRSRMGEFLVEGWRLIGDGLQAGCRLDTLIFSQLEDLEHLRPHMPKKGVKIYKMPYKEMQMWSGLDTCPGLMGVFKKPNTNIETREKVYPINVICDNIRDPGNLGSILRTCLGVGCNSILLTKGCVDIWDSKVLRSAGGAHFRMAIQANLDWDDISEIINTESSVLIADNNSDQDLIIKSKTSSGSNEYKEDDSDEYESDGEIQRMPAAEIPLTHYYKLDYGHMDSITLVIGGETQGISEECYVFARNRAGVRINIPLATGVDSLNSGMALGVIAFEIKKQLIEAGCTPSDSKVAIAMETQA